MNKTLREKRYPSGRNLLLIQGDITRAEVDAVVNPANPHLQHGGGLAGLLSKIAGPMLQAESNRWVEIHGPVPHHKPAYTSAGDLAFKTVIHAVGPVWGSGDEEAKLRAAVIGAIDLADQLKLGSLALPAISTGIFGYPLDEASLVILSAADEACTARSSHVHKVEIVLFDTKAAQAFSAAWDKTLI
jgi:O-acetyl-ADP-ribose deacetylase (regulator of RNase III)